MPEKIATPAEQAHLDKVAACLKALNAALAAARVDGMFINVKFGEREPERKFVGKLFDLERNTMPLIASPEQLIWLYANGGIDTDDELTPAGREWLRVQKKKEPARG